MRLNVHHPNLVIEDEVACPEAPPSTVPEADLVDVPAECVSLVALARLSPRTTASEAATNIRRFRADADPDGSRYLGKLLDAVLELPPEQALSDSLDEIACK